MVDALGAAALGAVLAFVFAMLHARVSWRKRRTWEGEVSAISQQSDRPHSTATVHFSF